MNRLRLVLVICSIGIVFRGLGQVKHAFGEYWIVPDAKADSVERVVSPMGVRYSGFVVDLFVGDGIGSLPGPAELTPIEAATEAAKIVALLDTGPAARILALGTPPSVTGGRLCMVSEGLAYQHLAVNASKAGSDYRKISEDCAAKSRELLTKASEPMPKPGSPEACLAAMALLARANSEREPARAARLCEEAFDLRPFPYRCLAPMALLDRAQFLRRAAEEEEAIAVYRQIVSDYKSMSGWEFYKRASNALQGTGRCKEAPSLEAVSLHLHSPPVILKPEASGTSLAREGLGFHPPRTDPKFFVAAPAPLAVGSETQRSTVVSRVRVLATSHRHWLRNDASGGTA